MTPDILIPGIDEVLILRVSYTVAALVGLPCALFCIWASIKSWKAIKQTGANGWLRVSSKGYIRRDRNGVIILLLIFMAGIIAVSGNLSTRSVFGISILLIIAVLTTHDRICDYQERTQTIPEDIITE